MTPTHTTRLPNGLQILSCPMPTRSATLGFWIINGVRHQAPDQNGYAHLLEHLLFKGTAYHDARALALRFEAMGGDINAHTGRELTALHGLVPADDLYDLAALFRDMLLQPGFTTHDVAQERGVVLQEMALIRENPEEALEEAAIERVWPGHPMGQPILGDSEVIQRAGVSALRDYLHGVLQGARLCVAAAGRVDHESLLRACAPLGEHPAGIIPMQTPPRFEPGEHTARRDVTQCHQTWLMPAPPIADPAYTALAFANHLLGAGTSSRLFQTLREERGLVYGVHSRLELYSDAGLWVIQTACDADRARDCRVTVADAVRGLIDRGPTPEEMENTRRHLRAGLLLEEDDPHARMERLAQEAIYLQRHPALEERLARIDAVTPPAVQSLLAAAWARTCYWEWMPLGK